MSTPTYQPGEIVVYSVTKFTPSPGPRAKDIQPAQGGENYTYSIDKFWVVHEINDDELLLITRKGKEHRVSVDDLQLRKPTLWERFVFRRRFQQLSESYDQQADKIAS